MTKKIQTAVQEGRDLKTTVVYAVIALGVILGGYYVYRSWTSADRPEKVTMLCTSPGCGHTTSEEPQIGSIPPFECGKCGKKSVYPAVKCPKCGAPNIWNGMRGISGPTKCTKCQTEITRGN